MKDLMTKGRSIALIFFLILGLSASIEASLLFEDTFETSKVGEPPNNYDRQTLNYWGSCSGNCTIVSDKTARSGNKSLMTYLNRLESSVSYRTEGVPRGPARNDTQQGYDYWYGFSTMIPNTHIPDLLSSDTIAQWHGKAGSGNPPVTLRLSGTSIHLVVRGDNTNKRFELGQYTTGMWTDWVFHFRWSWQSGTAITEVWRDGIKVIEYTGPNAYNDGAGPWLKMGLYKTAWRVGNEPDVRFDSSIVARIFYHDELRIAGGPDSPNAGYSDVDPANGGSKTFLEQPVGLNLEKIFQ